MTTEDEHTPAGPPAQRAAPLTLAPVWRKSTASNPTGNCVELAVLADGSVTVRNSRFPRGPHLTYTRVEIAAFLHGVHAGEFNDLLASESAPDRE